MGRVKTAVSGAGRLASRFQNWSGETWPVEAMILYRSQLAPGGAIHTPLQRAPLCGEE